MNRYGINPVRDYISIETPATSRMFNPVWGCMMKRRMSFPMVSEPCRTIDMYALTGNNNRNQNS
jgi:hypothetical protein